MSHVDGVDDGVTYGVRGVSTYNEGVRGVSTYNAGVTGISDNTDFNEGNEGVGVRGISPTGIGVSGSSTNNTGVAGSSSIDIGVAGFSILNSGVAGYSYNGKGVLGSSERYIGVSGVSISDIGVSGHSTDSIGVSGYSINGLGVWGVSSTRYGVWGLSLASAGVFGDSSSGPGVHGESSFDAGVYGYSVNFAGVHGYSPNSTGLSGISDNGIGVYASSSRKGTYAAVLNGRVYIRGPLEKPGGSFKIDHPLDPANKYLYHSFVESPDMKNIYDGVLVLDANGEAEIDLPDWFGALNKDFRYQLTAIGTPGPNLHIAEEISDTTTDHKSSSNSSNNNKSRFKIAGGTLGMKVSWQVTGIRKDPWANANRPQVEEVKPDNERGHYMYPDLYGQPEEKLELLIRETKTKLT